MSQGSCTFCDWQARSGWDCENFKLSDRQTEVLSAAYDEARTNGIWFSCDTPPKKFIFGATDSSDNYYGFVTYNVDGSVSPNEIISRAWGDMAGLHIYCKEVIAACWYIQRIARSNPNCTIVVGVDNSAAVFALRKMYSINLLVCKHLETTHECLQSFKCNLRVVSVRSKQNFADVPSRPDFKWDPSEIQRLQETCFQVLQDEMNGSRQTIRADDETNNSTEDIRPRE
jgi:hypothetical protein